MHGGSGWLRSGSGAAATGGAPSPATGSGGAPAGATLDSIRQEILSSGNPKDIPGTTVESVVGPGGVTVTTQKIVEANKVLVPEWEGVARMKKFIVGLVQACKVAGGRTDNLERDWILEVMKILIYIHCRTKLQPCCVLSF